MDGPGSGWYNSSCRIQIPINQGFYVEIETGGSQHRVGELVEISALVTDKVDGQPVLGADVLMNVTNPDYTLVPLIELRDDGVAPDKRAMDGRYTAVYPLSGPNAVGVYQVTTEASRHGQVGKSRTSFEAYDPFLIWNRTYGGEREDMANSLTPTDDGGCVIVGHTYSFGARNQDVYLVRIDCGGNKIWEKTYGGPKDDEAYAVVESGDGGYVVAGYTNCPTTYLDRSSTADMYLLKVNSDGDKVWEKNCGDPDRFDWAYTLARTSDGFILAGSKARNVGQELYRDACVLKVDTEGNEIWEKRYGESMDDRVFDILQTSHGGYVLTGFGNNENDLYVLRIDHEGNKIWEKTYGEPKRGEYGVAIAQRGEGYIVAGFTYRDEDLLLLGIDTQGSKVWERIYESSGSIRPAAMIQDRDGFIVVGALGQQRAYILKVGRTGEKVWETAVYDPHGMWANDIVKSRDGGYIVAGGRGDDLWVAKVKGTPWAPIPEIPSSAAASWLMYLPVVSFSGLLLISISRSSRR